MKICYMYKLNLSLLFFVITNSFIYSNECDCCDCCDCCKNCCDDKNTYCSLMNSDQIINDDGHIITDEKDFSREIKNKFLEICPNNEKYKNIIEVNIPEGIVDDYFSMYKDMVNNDIFLSEGALKLMAYRELLRYVGIVEALKNIFSESNKITWYPSICPILGVAKPNRFFLKKNEDGDFEVVLLTSEANIKGKPEEKDVKVLGGIYVNNELFKCLRCSGCEDKNCVSCLLFNLLKSFVPVQKRYKKRSAFIKDIRDMGKNVEIFEESFLHQSTDSALSNSFKKIIYKLLKVKPKNLNSNLFSIWNNKSTEFEKIRDGEVNEYSEVFFFIEWAITIELLKVLSPIVYGSEGISLYRTLNIVQLEKEYKDRRDFFESTSLFGPAFYFMENDRKVDPIYNCVKFNKIPIYRCIFNYIISTQSFSLFHLNGQDLDHEQEIGCITIGLNYEEMFDKETVKNGLDNSINRYKNSKNENYSSDFELGKKIFWYRQKFLIEQFLETIKKNIKKITNEKIKKIIFPKHFYSIHDTNYVESYISNVGDDEYSSIENFWLFNDEYSIEFEEEK